MTEHIFFQFFARYGISEDLEMFPTSDESVVCKLGRTAIILHTIKTDQVSIPLSGMDRSSGV